MAPTDRKEGAILRENVFLGEWPWMFNRMIWIELVLQFGVSYLDFKGGST